MLRKLELMHHLFGKDELHKCKECTNLCVYDFHGRTYRKCKVYGDSSSEATDWAGKWAACGMFCKRWGDKPVMRIRICDKECVSPIDGQEAMEGF